MHYETSLRHPPNAFGIATGIEHVLDLYIASLSTEEIPFKKWVPVYTDSDDKLRCIANRIRAYLPHKGIRTDYIEVIQYEAMSLEDISAMCTEKHDSILCILLRDEACASSLPITRKASHVDILSVVIAPVDRISMTISSHDAVYGMPKVIPIISTDRIDCRLWRFGESLTENKFWDQLEDVLRFQKELIHWRILADFSSCIPPVEPLSPFAKILPTAGPVNKSFIRDGKTDHSDVMKVWTKSSHLTSIPYLLILLRLNHCCPEIYLNYFSMHFRQYFSDKTTISGSKRTSRELYRLLYIVFQNAIHLATVNEGARQLWFRRLTADICQKLSRLDVTVCDELNSDPKRQFACLTPSGPVASTAQIAFSFAKFAGNLYPDDDEMIAVAARYLFSFSYFYFFLVKNRLW